MQAGTLNTPRSDRLAYSLDELAAAVGCTRRHLYSLIERGELRVVRLGRRVVVPRAEVERVLTPAEVIGAAE